jgi:hypothetical protein
LPLASPVSLVGGVCAAPPLRKGSLIGTRRWQSWRRRRAASACATVLWPTPACHRHARLALSPMLPPMPPVLTRSDWGAQLSPFKKIGTDERYVEEVLITAGDDVNQVPPPCLRAILGLGVPVRVAPHNAVWVRIVIVSSDGRSGDSSRVRTRTAPWNTRPLTLSTTCWADSRRSTRCAPLRPVGWGVFCLRAVLPRDVSVPCLRAFVSARLTDRTTGGAEPLPECR